VKAWLTPPSKTLKTPDFQHFLNHPDVIVVAARPASSSRASGESHDHAHPWPSRFAGRHRQVHAVPRRQCMGANMTDATTKAIMELFSEWERRGAQRRGPLKLLHSMRVMTAAILVICCVFWLLMFEFWLDMAMRLVMHVRTCHGSGMVPSRR
jgi:hypothetical protein